MSENNHLEDSKRSTNQITLLGALVSILLGFLGVAASWIAGIYLFNGTWVPNLGGFVDLVLVGAIGITVPTMIQPRDAWARMWCIVLAAISVIPYIMMFYVTSFMMFGASLAFIVVTRFPKRSVALVLAIICTIFIVW